MSQHKPGGKSNATGAARAEARANIAFVKYWGRADDARNLPLNDSISLTLDRLVTTTTIEFAPALDADEFLLNGGAATPAETARASRHLDHLRALAGTKTRARIVSENAFTTAGGLASSASGFAALTVAAAGALGLDLDARELSRIARLGSGSASRSLFGGFVRWRAGNDRESVAEPIVPMGHWDLRDVIVVVEAGRKKTGSADGHSLARTSPFLTGRLDSLPGTLSAVERGIRERDLAIMGPAIEAEALSMHAVMMTSNPSLLYWTPDTVRMLLAVRDFREERIPTWMTLDAGPNPHLICEAGTVPRLLSRLKEMGFGGEHVLVCGPGEGPKVDRLQP
ncbi:MAG: diphosphomevalonate decarboxylase [Thermoplasmatota archaeon]